MKIPKKEELLKLQAQYKADKKIGEALGGVPEYLVAYWRRKKKIGKYSLAKYAREKIKDLWETYGNDRKAGEELGISSAAFYKWRRKYNLLEKPKVLEFQQLELNLPSEILGQGNMRRQTIAQKLLAKKSGKAQVTVGEIGRAHV